LSRKYNVFTAENGKEAIGIMKEQDIQLVISDVMMPEMDGYELCKVIKESIEFSHIPIILLTAKTAEEDVVSAYQSGADGYLKKPFSVSVLNARIENLLQAREKRISEFKAQQVFNPQGLNYTTPDEEFIKQVMDCIYDNYTDPDFDQNRLAEVIGLSKSTIYRKLKSLIGMTTSNLIKDVRLKMARELLNKKGGARISEIAYMVGFNDPKYFSMCFKKEYGILPSELEE
jgi:two-component system sensor histidine kinase/response regulator